MVGIRAESTCRGGGGQGVQGSPWRAGLGAGGPGAAGEPLEGRASTCVLLHSGEGRVKGVCHCGTLSCGASKGLSGGRQPPLLKQGPSCLLPTPAHAPYNLPPSSPHPELPG